MARIFTGQTGRPRWAATGAACLIVVLALAGCAGTAATPAPSTAASTTEPSASEAAPSPTEPAAPVLLPTGTATDNLPYFDSVITATLATEANPPGRTLIDALVAAGFEKDHLEVTADTTTMGKPADSIQFAVKFNAECLVGQNGPSSGGFHSVVAPMLATGTCLVGATRQIDW
ncbi:hypothetical protein BJQ94_10655 [Cryobacterium sp. SO2]|uniref:DUF6993 domain-containing protein n=1 Tax=Cryobacterium sp. SO2 TaxID=1897060 RepID=UPI00223D003B|nr:hypothetical protein [Cryobacterium sp. SO2]WEO75845.1 hypothetical protein BJQ94_10655 [Cryobacterium sp. SO2]